MGSRVRLVRHESPTMRFELAFAAPHAAIRPYVREYVAWRDHSSTPMRRRELPGGIVPLIINFASTVRERKAGSAIWREYRTFTAGLHDAFTIVESAGPNEGMQVNFTALGARLFYARPLEAFTNCTLELADVLGADADRWIDRLYDAGSWEKRFDILDCEITARITGARQPARAVTWTWRELVRTGGSIRILDVARDVGWSERHLAAQFRHEIGLAPKGLARVLRFGRAVRALTHAPSIDLRDLALACGYCDQAHFTHDFRAFAGTTPTKLRENRFPDEAGFAAME
jgi:AraC-like DNA-binding protein